MFIFSSSKIKNFKQFHNFIYDLTIEIVRMHVMRTCTFIVSRAAAVHHMMVVDTSV